jgi:hypothetical protein
MNPRYRAIRVQIPFCIREHEHTVMCLGDQFWEVDAIECIGTGLAIQKVWYQPLRWEDYGLVHIASGTLLLQNTVPTLLEAGMWLRKIRGVCDWTQPAYKLKIQPETKAQVYDAWLDTLHDCHVLRTGKKLLTPSCGEYIEPLTGESVSQEE